MKYIRKLTLTGMRNRKAETKALVGILILVYTFSTLCVVFQESFLKGKADLRYGQYGEWQSAVCDAGTGVKKLLTEKSDEMQLGTILTAGTTFLDGEGIGKAGTMDRAMISLGHLTVQEGRFPKTEKEVAVEEHVLSLLPKDVKVGSEISLVIAVDEESNGETQKYVLTGIIKEWGDEWNVGGEILPDIVLGNVGDMGKTAQTSYFFKMSNEDGDYIAKINKLLKDGEKGIYVYNEKAYPQSISAMEQFFSDGIYVGMLLLIAVILILYALNISMGKRRYRGQMFRGMGASMGQMAYMALWESAAAFGPALVFGSILGIIGAWGILKVGKNFFKWHTTIVVNGFHLLEIYILITVLFILSVLLLTLYLSSLPLESSFHSDIGALQTKNLPVLKKVKSLSTIAMSKRNRKFHRKQTYLRIGFSVCAVTIMAISFFLFRENNKKYQFWREQVSNDYIFKIADLKDGVDLDIVKELEEIPGVVSVDKSKYLNVTDYSPQDIEISWAGWKGNEYVTTHRRYSQVSDSTQPYDKEGDYFSLIELQSIAPTDENSFTYYEEAVSEGGFHKEAFNEGKECILFLSPYQIRDTGGKVIDYNPVYVTEYDRDRYKHIYTYKTAGDIKCGDELKVSTPWGESVITVGGIVYEEMRPGENVIAVGERFLDTFFAEDTSNLYNNITIHSYAKANFAETDWSVEEVFRKNGIASMPTNDRIVYGEIAGQFATVMFQASIILLIAGLLFVLVMYQQNIAYFEIEKRKVGILRSLGMSKEELKKMYLFEHVMDVGNVSVVSLLAVGCWFLVKLRLDTSFDSIDTLLKAIKGQQEMMKMLLIIWVGVMIFYILVYGITISNNARKVMKQNIIDSIKEL